MYIARLYDLSAHPTALVLIIDCSCYDELKDNNPYRESILEDVYIMRDNPFAQVPSLEELKTTDVV